MVGTARRSGHGRVTSGRRLSRKAYRRSAAGSWSSTDWTRRHHAAISAQPGAEREPPNSWTESAAVKGRKLVVAVRETPLNGQTLRHLVSLDDAGATV
ncbi:hypothetical protein ABT086_29735, partial [Streptomyces mirabilis]